MNDQGCHMEGTQSQGRELTSRRRADSQEPSGPRKAERPAAEGKDGILRPAYLGPTQERRSLRETEFPREGDTSPRHNNFLYGLGSPAVRSFLYRASLRAGTEFKARTRRPFADVLSPFTNRNDQPLIVHCCYHKVGTVWFGRVLREVAAEFGLRLGAGATYDEIRDFETEAGSDVFIDFGSHVNLSLLPRRHKASHMIRDPRDLVVSGYFYHRWTGETWANLPRAEYRGMTYRQHLNAVSKHDGLLAEIRRNSFWIPHMARWKYAGPDSYEIRYEEIIRDEVPVLRGMFRHYEFREDAVKRSLEIARKYSFATMKAIGGAGENSHLRSGKVGEWREHFEPEHVALFKDLYPGAVEQLGYERSDDW